MIGASASSGGTGVRGLGTATSGPNSGVEGISSSTAGRGVRGEASSVTGINYGVFGSTNSPSGYAGYFVGGRNYFEGNVGVGASDPAVKVHVTGGSDANLGGGGYLVNGLSTGANLVLDDNEIMARNNGAVASLFLNANGGSLFIGNSTSTVNIAGDISLSATTRYFSIAGNTFTPATHAVSYIALGSYVYGIDAAEPVFFQAPVHLPHGAVITSLQVNALDDSAAENIDVDLDRVSESGASSELASTVSAGANASVQTITDNTIVTGTVDNNLYAYSVSASWTVPATASEIRLYRVQITYTVTSPLP
jgi:hypothetical protein